MNTPPPHLRADRLWRQLAKAQDAAMEREPLPAPRVPGRARLRKRPIGLALMALGAAAALVTLLAHRAPPRTSISTSTSAGRGRPPAGRRRAQRSAAALLRRVQPDVPLRVERADAPAGRRWRRGLPGAGAARGARGSHAVDALAGARRAVSRARHRDALRGRLVGGAARRLALRGVGGDRRRGAGRGRSAARGTAAVGRSRRRADRSARADEAAPRDHGGSGAVAGRRCAARSPPRRPRCGCRRTGALRRPALRRRRRPTPPAQRLASARRLRR